MDEKRWAKMLVILAGLMSLAALEPVASVQNVYRILTNYPNPFDSRSEVTTIYYTLAEESEVKVKIYDFFGVLVREYPAVRESAGIRRTFWDGTNEAGDKVAKGGYLCVLQINGGTKVLAMRKIGVVH
ncbi:MAG: FlgD immunoglobulin-like domain containing protein [Endomicrobiales bacterium]